LVKLSSIAGPEASKMFMVAEKGFLSSRIQYPVPVLADIHFDRMTGEISGSDVDSLVKLTDLNVLFAFKSDTLVKQFLESTRLTGARNEDPTKWKDWERLESCIWRLQSQGYTDFLGCDHDESEVYHLQAEIV